MINIILFLVMVAAVFGLTEIIARCCGDTLWRKSKEGTVLFDSRDGYFVIGFLIFWFSVWVIKKIISII